MFLILILYRIKRYLDYFYSKNRLSQLQTAYQPLDLGYKCTKYLVALSLNPITLFLSLQERLCYGRNVRPQVTCTLFALCSFLSLIYTNLSISCTNTWSSFPPEYNLVFWLSNAREKTLEWCSPFMTSNLLSNDKASWMFHRRIRRSSPPVEHKVQRLRTLGKYVEPDAAN